VVYGDEPRTGCHDQQSGQQGHYHHAGHLYGQCADPFTQRRAARLAQPVAELAQRFLYRATVFVDLDDQTHHGIQVVVFGPSVKSMGEFWLRKFAKYVI